MRTAKYLINFALLLVLAVILIRNSNPVEVDLLLWKVEAPLSLLLLGMTLLGAAISFLTVLLIGRRVSVNTAEGPV